MFSLNRLPLSKLVLALLALATVTALGCFLPRILRARAQSLAVARFTAITPQVGWVLYDYEFPADANYVPEQQGKLPPESPWLITTLGVDFFHDVVAARVSSDGQLAQLAECPAIRVITFAYVRPDEIGKPWVTNEGFRHIARLSRLEVLDMSSGAHIGDEGARHLRSLESLRHLNLEHSYLSDNGLGSFVNLTKLRSLDLTHNNITSLGVKKLVELSTLEELSLQDTQVDDECVPYLTNLKNLRYLNLAWTGVGRAIMELKGLPQLQRLALHSTSVGDAELQKLMPLPQLEELGLSRTAISDKGLRYIVLCSGLKKLDLTETHVTDEGMAILAELRNLEEVWLQGLQITDSGLRKLQGLSHLREVRLQDTRVSEAGKAEFRQALPHCQVE